MGDNAVNKSINIPLEPVGSSEEKKVNSFADAVEALGKVALQDYEDKTSNLSSDNIIGHIRMELINDWKHSMYGYRHSSLDLICNRVPVKTMSRGGYGITKLIEIIKGVNATFEQNDAIRALRDNMLQARR